MQRETGGRALESIGNNLFGKYESELENNPAAAKVNGWMVCYSIPSKSARSAYQFINQYEFVIFMKNVASVNHVEAKVREIAEHIQERYYGKTIKFYVRSGKRRNGISG